MNAVLEQTNRAEVEAAYTRMRDAEIKLNHARQDLSAAQSRFAAAKKVRDQLSREWCDLAEAVTETKCAPVDSPHCFYPSVKITAIKEVA